MAISIIQSVPNLAGYPKASNIFSPTEIRIIDEYAKYIAQAIRKQINYCVDSSIWIDPLITFLANKNDEFKVKPSKVLFDCSEVNELLIANEIAHSRIDVNTVTLSLSLLEIHSDKEVEPITVLNRMDFIDMVTTSIASELCPKRGIRVNIKANRTVGSIKTSTELLKYLILDALFSNSDYMYKRNPHLFVNRVNKSTISIAMDVGLLNSGKTTTSVATYNVFIETVCPNSDKAIKRKKRMTHTRARKGA